MLSDIVVEPVFLQQRPIKAGFICAMLGRDENWETTSSNTLERLTMDLFGIFAREIEGRFLSNLNFFLNINFFKFQMEKLLCQTVAAV